MLSIRSFLEKFKTFGVDRRASYKIVLEALLIEGIVLTEKDINIRDGIVYVHGHPTVRNLLQIKKQNILAYLHKNPLSVSVRDIR